MKHVTISPGEAADRLALRELAEAYAYSADRRDAKGQMALFTGDTHFCWRNPAPRARRTAWHMTSWSMAGSVG
jgi:hypothetical protein